MKDADCLPSPQLFYWFRRFFFFFFYIFEKDTGMCLLQQCHLARTSPEELGVFRNVDMATGSSLTRAPLLVSSTPENRFGTGLP